MKKTLYVCDRCGKETTKEGEFWLTENRVPDAAGGMDNEQYHADLCFNCVKAFTSFLCKKFDVRMPGKLLHEFIEVKKK